MNISLRTSSNESNDDSEDLNLSVASIHTESTNKEPGPMMKELDLSMKQGNKNIVRALKFEKEREVEVEMVKHSKEYIVDNMKIAPELQIEDVTT